LKLEFKEHCSLIFFGLARLGAL